MKEEVLRMDRVTFIHQGVSELNHFSMNIFVGEIMGLIPINSDGLNALLEVLRQNLPIHYGYIYYREKPVNHWLHSDNAPNRISVVDGFGSLADDLTVADNVFVLRRGFKKYLIHPDVLNKQLQHFLSDIDVNISANTYARDLSAFERFVVEIVKAVVAGNSLIILQDANTVVSEKESAKLRRILKHYAQKGISFLFISRHYEEVRQACDRVAFMVNGQISKILDPKQAAPQVIRSLNVDSFERLVSSDRMRYVPESGRPCAIQISQLYDEGINGLDFEIKAGECVVLQDLTNSIFERLIKLLAGEVCPENGSIRVGGKQFSYRNRREIAVIQKLPTATMLFPEMSYMDNLCFTMDHRLKRVWLNRKAGNSIKNEMAPWLSEDVFSKSIDDLNLLEKYDLVYARVLLQRPQAAIFFQPFMHADVTQRMHIWTLLEKLTEKGIAVIILAINLADTLSLADRLIQIQDGRIVASIDRDAFGVLPDSIPWHFLWQDKEKQ